MFEKFSKTQISKLRKDTSNFFIGSPEAEAESTFISKMQLNEVFEDFLEVLPELQTEKFIVTGRKGNGKSAIAENIYYLASNDPQYFCDFIKKSDVDIEKITQISQKTDGAISQELIIEWIILIKFIKQLIENEAITNETEIADLKVFLKKNSGFVDIKSNQIEEVLQSKGWEINVEYFKRFLTSKFGNKFDIKSSKAPFYKLLPHLKETVRVLFRNVKNRDNNYILIFDDLDIGFHAKNQSNIVTILNILRVVKDYNISFFGKEGINAKIILLLRSDISRILLNQDADTAKIFSSYEIPLNWYEYSQLINKEDDLKIKQFINKRIALNFKNNDFDFDEANPWESFISEDSSYSKSSFKYVIDHTLIRPRDLILFFKPLSALKFPIPLSKANVNTLLGKYSIEFVKELRNELTAHYSSEDIEAVLKALNNCINPPVSFNDFEQELSKFKFSDDSLNLCELLFDLSIIGNISEDGNTYFKHWEENDEIFKFNANCNIIPHFTLRNYLQRKR
jgi:Cdc6-like AAA superfamily ATPase